MDENQQRDKSWFRLDVDETLEELDAGREGLDSGEADLRLERHGPNAIRSDKEVGPWAVLLNHFKSPLVDILIGALVVTVSIQRWSDAIVIGFVLLVNGTIGVIQEYRAESAVQSLMENLTPADQEDMAFMGTAVTAGHAEGVVVATGRKTQLGQIAEDIQ
jgi:Ca2+-transporting ATPase